MRKPLHISTALFYCDLYRESRDMTNTDRAEAEQPDLPLSGITVIDLTLARAGPTCVRHLADWGANIIRIWPPTRSVMAGAAPL